MRARFSDWGEGLRFVSIYIGIFTVSLFIIRY